MNSTKKALLGATLLGLSASALNAQEDPNAPARLPSQPVSSPDAAGGQPLLTAPGRAIDATTGLMQLDNGWIGGGSDWEALFEASRVRFLPVLPDAPTTAELVWTTAGVARGNGQPMALIAAEPKGTETADQRLVEYRRGFVTETYEMRLDGLKQSFVFDSLPAGSGDLVVHGKLDSVLPLAEQNEQGLRFASEGIGAVTIGKVTGIDAAGESVEGSIVFDGRNTEFRLPGAWVDQAQLPIIVDPLIGAERQLGSATLYDETDPATAYDSSEDAYFVVWRRRFSATQILIRGQRLNGDGSNLGGIVFITPSGTLIQATPDVANVSTEDTFGVVWAQSGDILCRRVTAATGALSAEVAIANSTNFESAPSIGGESTLDNEALVVWDDSTLGIRARSVTFSDIGDPFLQQSATVAGNTDFPSSPSVSKSGGFTGNHLIVWNDQGGTGSNTRVLGRVYNRNVGVLTPARVIESTEDADLPQCDGNGSYWVVAWEAETTVGGGDNDVEARVMVLSEAGTLDFASSTQDIASDLNDDERAVDVAWMGSSALVTWADEVGPGSNNYDVYVRQIDAITAAPLFFQTLISGGTQDQDFLTVCSTFSGNPNDTTEEALFAFQETGASLEETRIRRWGNNVDGTVTNLGGGCGVGGNFYTGAALIGNDLTLTLTDAPASQTAILIFAFDTLNAPCGTCTLVPNPYTGITDSFATLSDGNIRVTLAIPSVSSLRGLDLYAQWGVTDTTSPSCTAFDLDFSDALEITIQ